MRAWFGQFLSSFRVMHKVPPGLGLRELAPEYGLTPARFDELVSPESVNRLGSPDEGGK